MKRLLSLLFVLLSGLASGQVVADSSAGMLTEKHYGNVAYLSGGVARRSSKPSAQASGISMSSCFLPSATALAWAASRCC